MQFRFPWRSYQQRVLNDLLHHLNDSKLHIVAPPGSGKTVLGLQVLKLLNKPTLVLTPTRTIRNQWAARLIHDFLNHQSPDWLSMDLKKPNVLTISTYQALHAAYKSDKELLLKLLQSVNIKTVVVDECHHLQKEWWRSLMAVVKKINPNVVALTATPPYDVSGLEWQRYQELCGKVDYEINVAELIAEQNLCPHQDYIYASLPTHKEQKEITDFRIHISEFMEDLRYNAFFIGLIKEHPFLTQPDENLEAIYQNPSYFSAMLVFLNGVMEAIPISALGIIGADLEDLPSLDTSWLQILLQQVFYHDTYFEQYYDDVFFKKILTELKRIGAVKRKKINLQTPDTINKQLRISNSKLHSIKEIIDLEYEALKENLRMVVLTDYIRKEQLPKSELEVQDELTSIGVVPIFELVRQQFPVRIELGVLTGSLIIIPTYSEQLFDTIVLEKGLSPNDITKKALPYDGDYLMINASGSTASKIVALVTELFTRGGITILVGTKSLLGEGWDAPAINSLILATVVGSFVLSNQMRGRAIRTQKGNPLKTANIWHLVCLDPTDPSGGDDFKNLKRRFKAFHGVSFDEKPNIENGIGRFHLPPFPLTHEKVAQLNSEMAAHAYLRSRLQTDWNEALNNGTVMREEIKVPVRQTRPYREKKVFLTQHIQQQGRQIGEYLFQNHGLALGLTLAATSLIAYFFSFWWSLALLLPIAVLTFPSWRILAKNYRLIKNYNNQNTALLFAIGYGGTMILAALLSVGVAIGLELEVWVAALAGYTGLSWGNAGLEVSPLNKGAALLEEHEDVTTSIRKMAKAVLYALIDTEMIFTPKNQLTIITEKEDDGAVACFITGGSNYEEQLFMEAMEELLSPIENPRYLLRLETSLFEKYKNVEFLAVPTVLARKKHQAELLLKHWATYINTPTTLHFTRTIEGRKLLLKARGQGLAGDYYANTERWSVWR